VIDSSSQRAAESLVRQLQNATGDVLVVATIPTFTLSRYAVVCRQMFQNHGRESARRRQRRPAAARD
jgi:hypothetical protein